ncbi:MAG: glycerol ABC transporter substrate-binding protein [Halanaeroarchaeum sp.]
MALQSDRLALGLLVVGIVIAAFLYSVLVMRAPLQIVSIVFPLVGIYLLWRFVRAHERIAAAMESRDGAGGVERVD